MSDKPDRKGDDGGRHTIEKPIRPGKKKASCWWDGKRWSHGGVVVGPDKKKYKCVDGEWVEQIEVTTGDAVLEREAPSPTQTPEQAS